MTITHWINGVEVLDREEPLLPVEDPATGLVIGEVPVGGDETVTKAVEAAAEAQRIWARTSLSRRAEVLFRMRQLVVENEDRLASLISKEHGKTVDDARGEILRGRECLEYACAIAQASAGSHSPEVSTAVDVTSIRQPLGVAVGITPFNFPVMVPMWMHPLAIALGNAFVLKPSEQAPSASCLVARLYQEAGLPNGVFNVVHGDAETATHLIAHARVEAVSFVGSTPVAQSVHRTATAHGKRVQALGGANNHVVVLPDADVEVAAQQVSAAAFGSAGQRCMATPVIVAVGDVADPLRAALEKEARRIRVGPGSDGNTQMGPVITAQARDRIKHAVTNAVAAGAVAVTDGRDVQVPGHEDGYFVGPTILDNVTTDMAAYCDEVFGPVLVMLRVGDLDEALAVVNASPFGNGSTVFTRSGAAARRFASEVDVGMVGINVAIPVPVAHASFGGWKASLFGDHHVYGPEGVRFYTRAKVVTTRWPESEPPDPTPDLAFR